MSRIFVDLHLSIKHSYMLQNDKVTNSQPGSSHFCSLLFLLLAKSEGPADIPRWPLPKAKRSRAREGAELAGGVSEPDSGASTSGVQSDGGLSLGTS